MRTSENNTNPTTDQTHNNHHDRHQDGRHKSKLTRQIKTWTPRTITAIRLASTLYTLWTTLH